MKKKFLLSVGTVIIGSSAIFSFCSQASAFDVKAGPIWNNNDAKVKCPVAARAHNGRWNGQWRTTIPGKQSVCGVYQVFSVKAGPIWNNNDARVKCPVAARAHNGRWNGQWRTTIPGKQSICGVVRD
jgi:uncharacterized lipoprotein YajG